MLSSFLPPRTARSRARGWSHRTTPVVQVPAPASVTATCRPREIASARDRHNYGEFRDPVERLRRHDQHRTAALLLVPRRRIETDEPDCANSGRKGCSGCRRSKRLLHKIAFQHLADIIFGGDTEGLRFYGQRSYVFIRQIDGEHHGSSDFIASEGPEFTAESGMITGGCIFHYIQAS